MRLAAVRPTSWWWTTRRLISRAEVVGTLLAICDIAEYMKRLVGLIEGDDGGEEEEETD